MTRVSWFRLILGLVLGLILGLYYAWFASPRQIHQSTPQDLSPDFQNEYRTLVASAFASTGNLTIARTRLDLLDDFNPASVLNDLAQSHLATGRADEEVRAVAQLASALGEGLSTTDPTLTSSPEASSSDPSPSPIGATAQPTATNTPMPAFRLVSIEKVCDPNLISSLIQVIVEDVAGEGVPGVGVVIIWDQGEDRFLTGMKPEFGLGYGDFTMQEGVTYALQIASTFESVSNLKAQDCTLSEGGIYPGSVLLRFKQQ